MRTLITMFALALAALPIVGVDAASAKKPKLKSCPALQPLSRDDIARNEALVVPRAMRKVAVATRERLAVSTLKGATLCIDMRLRGEVEGLALSADKRFLSFDWAGYESAGHILVDRSGTGQQVDTSEKPVLSPSRQRMVGVVQSEASDSDRDGLRVWHIDTVGLRPLGPASDLPDLADWRIDGWVREDCIDLSGIPLSRLTGRVANIASSARDRYMAAPYGNGWRVVRTTRGCAAS